VEQYVGLSEGRPLISSACERAMRGQKWFEEWSVVRTSRHFATTQNPSLSTHLRYGSQGRFRRVTPPGALPPVDKKSETRLTGPVNHGVLFKVNCSAHNPSAAMRDGFCCEALAVFSTTRSCAT
jgi:hypothetical protein